MIGKMIDGLAPPTCLEIPSDYDLRESIVRLSAVVRKPRFRLFWESDEYAVGEVSQNKVQILRIVPYVRNSFRRRFSGRFIEIDGRVMLTGRIAIDPGVRAFTSLWFGMLGLFFLLMNIAILFGKSGDDRASDRWGGLILGYVTIGIMFGCGIAMVKVCSRMDDSATNWYSDLIRSRLTKPKDPAA